jgi:hypothetical protein
MSNVLPRYQTNSGQVTTEDDPKRMVWYGLCGYWTDKWDLLKSSGGIPVCPDCRAPGMLTFYQDWEKGAKKYEEANPGYLAYLSSNKESCKKSVGGFLKSWEAEKAKGTR